MLKNHQRLLAFGIAAACVAGLGAASGVLAIDVDQTGLGATAKAAGVSNSKSIAAIVGSFVNALLSLMGVIMLLLTIYAGFTWMTAQGDLEKVKRAKGIITNAAVGMVIIFSAYSISDYVVKNVFKATMEGSSNGSLSEEELQSCLKSCADGSITVDPSLGKTCEQSCRGE